MTTIDGGLRRAVFRSRSLTRLIVIAKAVRTGLLKPICEPDFEALRELDLGGDLALDVGASSGEAAASILAVRPDMNVVAIEPNPACHQALDLVASLQRRITVIKAGAGEKAGELPFYVPVRSNRPLLQEGTFQREALEEPAAIRRNGRAGEDYQLRLYQLPVIRVDSLNLSPAFVKIDVQGFELEALRGMADTLQRSRPVLMIEQGLESRDVHAHLQAMGYEPHLWNGRTLQPGQDWSALNAFFLPA